MTFSRSALLVTLVLGGLSLSASGCVSGPDDPATRYAIAQAKQQRLFGMASCEARLEVYPRGMRPQRPFQVLGPVDGRWGWTPESRFSRMRKKACELGAHAIVDAFDGYEQAPGRTTTIERYDRFGRPVVIVEEHRDSVRRTSALAIVFTDVPRGYVVR